MVVYCARNNDGQRQVTEILTVGQRVENGIIESATTFRMENGQLVLNPTGVMDHPKFEAAGINILDVIGGFE